MRRSWQSGVRTCGFPRRSLRMHAAPRRPSPPHPGGLNASHARGMTWEIRQARLRAVSAMRRSGVRIPLAPPVGTSSDQGKCSESCGVSCVLGVIAGISRTPRAPQVVVQAVQTRLVGVGTEEVQVPVRRRDRLVPAPRLDRSRLDATGQPQCAAGRAAVDPARSSPTPARGACWTARVERRSTQ
jgi:hypothetical protein